MRGRVGVRRAAVGLACALLVLQLAGCGARTGPGTPLVQADPVETDSHPLPHDQASASPPAVDQGPGSLPPAGLGGSTAPGAPASSAPSEGYVDPDADMISSEPDPAMEEAQRRHNKVLRVRVSPACAHPGGVLVATFRGPPGATVAMTAAFADGKSHGVKGFGVLDAGGAYDWRIVVPPDVPNGPGRVAGASAATEDAPGGTADGPFRIGDC